MNRSIANLSLATTKTVAMRSCLTQTKTPALSLFAGFHTSSTASAKMSKHTRSLLRIQKHFARELQKPKPEDVDPVLGRQSVPFLERMRALLSESENMAFGLTSEEIEKLIYGAEQAAILRVLSTETSGKSGDAGSASYDSSSENHAQPFVLNVFEEKTSKKREAVRRILSMQNSSLEQRKKLAIEMARKEFARVEGDTGSSEVQAAVFTVRIQFLATHLKENKNDISSKHQLQQLVHDRQAILKYLRRKNPERYYWTIEKLGLSDEAVINEFSMSRRYLDRYQFFGINTLKVKDNKKERAEKIKYQRLEKKAQKFISLQKNKSS